MVATMIPSRPVQTPDYLLLKDPLVFRSIITKPSVNIRNQPRIPLFTHPVSVALVGGGASQAVPLNPASMALSIVSSPSLQSTAEWYNEATILGAAIREFLPSAHSD